jgi:thiol-disulfide isomerase/thioredoxin
MKTSIIFVALFTLTCDSKIKNVNGNTGMAHDKSIQEFRLPKEGEFPSLAGATGWLYSQPLTAKSLRGKIVLVNFCTYSCINWLRSLPYVRAWDEKYRDKGLVVIGVHTPEFTFEKNTDNIRSELAKRKIDYPIAIDNDYAVWNAFNNHFWPALYFIDAKGNIRHHQFGEGEYEKTELIIKQLLLENGAENISKELVSVNATGDEAAPDWKNLNSPETYLGYDRTENFASRETVKINGEQVYTIPARLRLNQWGLSGEWQVKNDIILLKKGNGRIAYRFKARDLHLVMGPAIAGTSIRFRVLIDGKPPGAAHGTDVDEEGNGIITAQRMYQLIRQPKPVRERQFEIEFLEPGVEAFVFTFG